MLNTANNPQQVTAAARIPLGFIAPASEYKRTSLRLRGPVLEQIVSFDPTHYVRERRLTFGFIPMGGEIPMLNLVLYLGDARLIWVTDPTDPELWRAIDEWKRNRSVVVALTRGDTHMFSIPLQPKHFNDLEPYRRIKNEPKSDNFVNLANAIFKLDGLDKQEHASAPNPTVHRNSCLLHTAGVATSLKRLGFGTVAPESKGITVGFYAELS